MVVDVLPGMTLAQVIIRLREATGDSVTIRISPDSALLLTANEFRALSLAAEREHVAIAVETRDGLRRQLATLFGVPLAIPMDEEEQVESPTDHQESETAPQSQSPGLQDEQSTTTTPPFEAGSGSEKRPIRQRGGGISFGKLLASLAAVALIGAMALAGYWYFFRSAEIRLVPVTQPVSSTIAFSVLRPGADSASGGIPTEQVSFDLSVSLDAPATGVETIGRTTAEGELVLRNPASEPVSISAGTTVQTFEGDTFVINQDITVPAATPDGSAGEATAAVSAAEAGSSANRDAGMLSGRLDNGVFYSNRGTPVAGGTDETTTVVTQEDLDALAARAEETLRALASTSSLSGNRRVVPSSLAIQQMTNNFSAAVGDEAASVSVDTRISFDALAFPTEPLDTGAEQALEGQIPSGSQLTPGSLTYGVPAESGENNGSISLIMPVSGLASALLSAEDMNRLAEEVEGMSSEDANALLSQDSGFTSVSVAVSPSWLPQQLPNDAARIEVVIE